MRVLERRVTWLQLMLAGSAACHWPCNNVLEEEACVDQQLDRVADLVLGGDADAYERTMSE